MTSTATQEPFIFSPATAAQSAATVGDGSDRLVNETRREIAEIVREVAVAVRSDRTTNEFFGLLVDRIQRAMAAEGVLVWYATTDRIECVRQLGRITTDSIPDESVATHDRLLAEVISDGQPVVVPATPGATDADVPANPMHVPVALVPIELEPSADGPSFLLEVFLESDCGVATRRGYLRFVAQMADLAGEFLRSDQLRSMRRRLELASNIDSAIAAMHRIDDRKKLEAAIVDFAADLFGFDRVGLCFGNPTKLIAVSHVDTIDMRSEAARQLCTAARTEIDPDGCCWIDASEPSGDRLQLRAVVANRDTHDRLSCGWKLVCMQVADVEPVNGQCREELVRFMQHADLALGNSTRRRPISLSLQFTPQWFRGQTGKAAWRCVVAFSTVSAVVLIAAWYPVPLVVSSVAVIRPEQVQTIIAPRDSMVQEVHVQHGQQVSEGDLLVSLFDPELDEQITTLVGRRAVLVQQKSHWTGALVDTASHEVNRTDQVQGESRLVAEEIQSIDNQLTLLRRAEEQLLIHAQQEGVVDAWQVHQRLQSRPLHRGDWLLQVIATDSNWEVEAKVPQSRIGHLNRATKNEELLANVSLDSDPTKILQATLKRIGPAIAAQDLSPSSTAVLLKLDRTGARQIAADQGTSDQSGAPARVMFHCGTAPAAFVLFQDVIRSVRGTVALYFGGETRDEI